MKTTKRGWQRCAFCSKPIPTKQRARHANHCIDHRDHSAYTPLGLPRDNRRGDANRQRNADPRDIQHSTWKGKR